MDKKDCKIPFREQVQLNNGLLLTVFKKVGAPIAMSFTMNAGARFDPIGKDGLAHFCEHMLVSGTEIFPNKTHLAKHVEQLGGFIGASTGHESLNINIELGDPKDTEECINTLGQVLNHSLFNEGIIETERGAIFSEIRVKHSKNDKMVISRLHDLMYKNDPFGRMVLGTTDSVSTIRRDDIVEYFKERFTNKNSILVIAGDVDINQVSKLVEKNITPYSSKKDNETFSEIRKQNNGLMLTVETNESIDEIYIAIGFYSPSILSKESVVLDLIAELLGGGRSSLLMQKLRYENGFVYSVHAENNPGSDNGEFIITTSAKKEDVYIVIKYIIDEIKKITNGDINEDDFIFAKNKYIKSKMIKMETSRSWVNGHYYGLLFDKNYSVIDSDNQIEKTDMAELVRVARVYLDTPNIFISLGGNISDFDPTKLTR